MDIVKALEHNNPELSGIEQKKEEFNLNKYAGVITLFPEPLEYQQQIRNEWK